MVKKRRVAPGMEKRNILEKKHDFFIGVDSDGAVFPTMELKQKECFHPAIMDCWGLWPVERELRMVAEWVNLYSVHRGTNRFPALKMVFEYLREIPEVRQKQVKVRRTEDLAAFINSGLPLGNHSLEEYVGSHPELSDVLAWSREIDRRVAETVKGVPPFPFVRESLEKIRTRAEVMVVSATPLNALLREWRENRLHGLVDFIAGQEMGGKPAQLRKAAGKYAPDKILMVGDALGDLQAVAGVGGLFYPVNPGREEESWERFYREAADLFFNGAYAGGYQEKLRREFQALLPEEPSWLL